MILQQSKFQFKRKKMVDEIMIQWIWDENFSLATIVNINEFRKLILFYYPFIKKELNGFIPIKAIRINPTQISVFESIDIKTNISSFKENIQKAIDSEYTNFSIYLHRKPIFIL